MRHVSSIEGPILAAATLLVVCAAGCGPGLREARETIDRFLVAVQQDDAETLFCTMTGAAGSEELGADPEQRRETFARWLASELDVYETGRDEGWVELDGHGVLAAKLFALRKGTFYELAAAERLDSDTMRVRMDLRFGYSAVDLSRFSPGLTLYFCGAPPGRVHAIRVPRGSAEQRAEVLERLSLEWTLVREDGSDGCPQGWKVGAVRPLDGTAETSRVTWAF
jgi:hypothetical protein